MCDVSLISFPVFVCVSFAALNLDFVCSDLLASTSSLTTCPPTRVLLHVLYFRAHVALQEPRQALDALKRHGCLATPPPPALSSSSSSSSSPYQQQPTPSSPVHLNPPHMPPPSTHRPGGAPPLSSSFPSSGIGIGGGSRGAGSRADVEGDGGHRGGPPESATSTPGHDFLMRGGGASPLGVSREEGLLRLFRLGFLCHSSLQNITSYITFTNAQYQRV